MRACKVLILILLSILLLTGCSSSDSVETQQLNKQVQDLKVQVEQLQKENAELKGISLEVSNADTSNSSAQPTTQKVIKLGEPVVELDFCEFTIKKVEFANEIKPPKPDSYYTYYQVKDSDVIYLHIVSTIKNLQTSGVTSDEFAKVTITYNNKYNYDCFATIEERGGSDFTYTNITEIEPLKVGNMHFIGEIPLSIEDEVTPLYITVSLNGNNYIYNVR